MCTLDKIAIPVIRNLSLFNFWRPIRNADQVGNLPSRFSPRARGWRLECPKRNQPITSVRSLPRGVIWFHGTPANVGGSGNTMASGSEICSTEELFSDIPRHTPACVLCWQPTFNAWDNRVQSGVFMGRLRPTIYLRSQPAAQGFDRWAAGWPATAIISAQLGLRGDALLQQHNEQIELVLTDLAMSGMNGVELTQRLKKLSPTTPVILCAGFS